MLRTTCGRRRCRRYRRGETSRTSASRERAGAGIDFLERHAQVAHRRKRIQHGKRADAVGDEIRRVFGNDDALAKLAIAEISERVELRRGRCRPGNNFDQFQIARRIEEMRAGPVLLPFLGQAFGDAMHGQAGSIRGDDGAGLAKLRDFCEKARLISRFSATTSIIQSASASAERSSSKLPTEILAANSGAKKAAGLDFFAASIPERASLLRSAGAASLGTMSSRRHGRPAFAKCAAMRAPIVPAPRTTAFCILCVMARPYRGDLPGTTDYKTERLWSNKCLNFRGTKHLESREKFRAS